MTTYQIADALRKEIRENKTNLTLPRNNSLSISITNEILHIASKTLNLTKDESFIIIAIFAQQGGCAKSCDGNLPISFFNKSYTLATIRKIFTEAKQKNGLRKFAKTHCEEIGKVAEDLGIDGNLYAKISRLHPNKSFSKKEKILLSDFQLNNPQLSNENKALISETFNKKSTYRK